MNSDVYIFGKLGSYYSQYPDDFTSEIFMKMGEWHTPADTYISVHRKGELMYYGYVRKLKADCYIGFCSVLNGMVVTDLNALFEVFDSMLNHLAVSGEILKYSDSGEIVANAQSLVYGKPILNQVRALLKDGLSGLSANLKGLPPESYGISVSESKQFDLHTDDMSQIVSASWSYSYTFIAKDSGTPAPDSYQGVIRRLYKERKVLEVTNSDLSNQILKLKREKKQQGMVILLGTAAIICFFILLGVKQSLDETQKDLNKSRFVLEDMQTKLDDTQTNFANAKKQNEEMQSNFTKKISVKDNDILSLQKTNKQKVEEIEKLRSENYNLSYKLQYKEKELNDYYNMKRDLNYYKNELQRADTEIKNLRDEISQYTQIQSQSQPQSSYISGNTSRATTTINAPLRIGCSNTASTKMNIPKGATIDVYRNEYRNRYYKVKYGQTVGYMFESFIDF